MSGFGFIIFEHALMWFVKSAWLRQMFALLCISLSKHPFCGTYVNSADPDQMPQNVASDQGLHCLLTECPIMSI